MNSISFFCSYRKNKISTTTRVSQQHVFHCFLSSYAILKDSTHCFNVIFEATFISQPTQMLSSAIRSLFYFCEKYWILKFPFTKSCTSNTNDTNMKLQNGKWGECVVKWKRKERTHSLMLWLLHCMGSIPSSYLA